jgi:hypothetical protein
MLSGGDMLNFEIEGHVAMVHTDCEGCRFTITIERHNHEKITKEEAEIIFSQVMQFLPNRIRY